MNFNLRFNLKRETLNYACMVCKTFIVKLKACVYFTKITASESIFENHLLLGYILELPDSLWVWKNTYYNHTAHT